MASGSASPRPTVVAFDVVGTLFSLEPLGASMKQAGLPEGSLGEWFSRFLRDAMALDAAGVYVPFREVASATLEVIFAEKGVTSSTATVDSVLQAASELPAHPDVHPAFTQLSAAGIRVVTLTNGGAEATERLLKRAGVDAFVERVISVDEVRHWKPRREVYLHAAKVTSVPPEADVSRRGPRLGRPRREPRRLADRLGRAQGEEVPHRDGRSHRAGRELD
jgi:2-haloacid dehalogenase